MIIGIPKEIKPQEGRVAMTPAGVMELTRRGHTVYLQKSAGEGSNLPDERYQQAGAMILDTIEEIYAAADMIVKVKEPLEREYGLIRKGQVLFTYFHFASNKKLTGAMMESGAVCIAYETVMDRQGALPLLTPMSEVAGRLSVQQGAKYLEKPQGGKGVLLGGVPGVSSAEVVIIGAGVVGHNAALMAAGLGANVKLLDVNLNRLRYLSEVLPSNVKTLYSTEMSIRESLRSADLVIGATLIVGAKAPHLVSREMLKEMTPGTVMIDVSVDQGGCFETTHSTTHMDPIYEVDGIVHYCVANMPGAVPVTSTRALTNATLPYVTRLAEYGWEEACKRYEDLRQGLNILNGEVVYKNVADSLDLPYTELRW
ncbi:MAG: Alanine dehydrogenase [Proteiniphilum acetatigenes]|uniref:Alanine dehydrogenase n=1 Tax=Proteiniphilum acetatigenes TaxID=294710 RepID=A0A101HKM7_9BACT|nr:MAG: Alanine dehydrogenase [Proteiniphilum acetatigenes]KUL19978.1 MAG: Alanine dehydrogenase [Proteiniphilum sp. 51_7]HCC85236.1 alanine dehydrogenase [Porphyromonadaceae bacterium]